MMKSMTAYALNDKSDENAILNWEIRTVNHRYLDISLSLPNALVVYENDLKEVIRCHLGRGKLDAKLTLVQSNAEDTHKIQINADAVRALRAARQKIEALTKKSMSLSAMDILQWPGVIQEEENNPESNLDAVKDLLIATLVDLIKMRELEGGRLAQLILSRCETVSAIVQDVRERRVIVQSAIREKRDRGSF